MTLKATAPIPPLSQFIPGFKDPINYFGIFVPQAARPPEVAADPGQDLGHARSAKSEALLQKYAQGARRACSPRWRAKTAQKAVFPAIQSYAWTQQAAGKAKVSPDTVGIPKP